MRTGQEHEVEFTVDAGHPALAGHFPGDPVLPGVVILDAIITAAEEWLGRPLLVTGLPQVKFVSPLRPGDEARIRLTQAAARIDFRVQRGEVTVALGAIRTGPAASGE